MSVAKRWVADPFNQTEVLQRYRDPTAPTIRVIAERLGTTTQNVAYVLKTCMPEAERKAQAALRYSLSKTGAKNPMKGKSRDKHPRWVGECEDGKGYLTCLYRGRREFVHRMVVAKALGLDLLPKRFDVHHIDGDPKNNSIDNLALVTVAGHRSIHFLQVKDSQSLRLKRFTLAELSRSTTSR